MVRVLAALIFRDPFQQQLSLFLFLGSISNSPRITHILFHELLPRADTSAATTSSPSTASAAASTRTSGPSAQPVRSSVPGLHLENQDRLDLDRAEELERLDRGQQKQKLGWSLDLGYKNLSSIHYKLT